MENGLADGAGLKPRNTDNDGVADFRDFDSENDSILDIAEAFGIAADANNDGMLDNFTDTDSNGIDDLFHTESAAPFDTDGDGITDSIEIDSDGDGITDLTESGGIDNDGDGVIDNFADANGDGIDDAFAAIPTIPNDSDGDGIPDFQDTDSDNDGISDLLESGGIDADGDGNADSLLASSALPDINGDGIPDYLQSIGADITPQPEAELEPELGAGTGEIRTGLEGSGCSIISVNGSTRIDPTLPLLGTLALMGLALRRRTASATLRGVKKSGKAATIVAAIASFFISGCSTTGQEKSISSHDGLLTLNDQQDYEDTAGIQTTGSSQPVRLPSVLI